MNPENQNLENLRRLLKLKRYELPPPRYFSNFSGQVMNRIRAGYPEERPESLAVPWLQRVLSVLEAKPLLAGAFGAVVVGVLVGGAFSSDKVEIPGDSSNLAVSQVPSPVGPVRVAVGNSGAFALGGGSTNVGSIFDAIGTPSVQPVNYTPFGQ